MFVGSNTFVFFPFSYFFFLTLTESTDFGEKNLDDLKHCTRPTEKEASLLENFGIVFPHEKRFKQKLL